VNGTAHGGHHPKVRFSGNLLAFLSAAGFFILIVGSARSSPHAGYCPDGQYVQGGVCLSRDATFPDDLIEFHQRYSTFLRTYLGCKSDTVHFSECDPDKGVLDAKEYRATREAAKKAFGLKDK
jgi:hypothetical protein